MPSAVHQHRERQMVPVGGGDVARERRGVVQGPGLGLDVGVGGAAPHAVIEGAADPGQRQVGAQRGAPRLLGGMGQHRQHLTGREAVAAGEAGAVVDARPGQADADVAERVAGRPDAVLGRSAKPAVDCQVLREHLREQIVRHVVHVPEHAREGRRALDGDHPRARRADAGARPVGERHPVPAQRLVEDLRGIERRVRRRVRVAEAVQVLVHQERRDRRAVHPVAGLPERRRATAVEAALVAVQAAGDADDAGGPHGRGQVGEVARVAAEGLGREDVRGQRRVAAADQPQ